MRPGHHTKSGGTRDPPSEIFGRGPRVINVGLEGFAADLERLGVPVTHVDWAPPAGADPRRRGGSPRSTASTVRAANDVALRRLVEAHPVLVDCRPAREAIGLAERTVLHAGPPLAWAPDVRHHAGRPSCCAVRYEGWAPDDAAARDLVLRGEVRIAPCHGMGAVGPMTGIVTASMPVFVVENRAHGNRASATINEGLGKVLRFGANDDTVIGRLRWLEHQAGPLLGAAIRATGGIDLRAIMSQALRMGDEMHQRNVAASALLGRVLMPRVARAAAARGHRAASRSSWVATTSSS